MSSRKRRKKKKTGLMDFINLISAVALIVIAVLFVVFVYQYIHNNSIFNHIDSGSLSLFQNKKQDDIIIEGITSEEAEVVYGLNELQNNDLIYIIDPSKLSKYDEDNVISLDDGTKVLANTWYEQDGDLYFFGEEGLALSAYSENGMDYAFDKQHRLSKIEYNKAYYGDDQFEESEYVGLVKTKILWAFLDEDKQLNDLYAIRYRKAIDSLSYLLGGDVNPQYTSRYSMSISDGYIYYLACSDSTNKIIEPIANKLFRMKPGSLYREIVAENCVGYKILEREDREDTIYYYDGTSLQIATSFEKDETMHVFPEDANYYVDIEGDHAVVKIEGGYPVTLESADFKAGNFSYAINAQGEIQSVASKKTVIMGGYVYSFENGEAFGTKKSRLLRKDNADKTEVVSSEFIGEVSNIHYDFGDSRIIAEYKDANGGCGLISVSLEGDVDILSDATDLGSRCELYAINGHEAIVKTADSFKKISLSKTYPLAAGVSPVAIIKPETVEKIGPTSGDVNKTEAVNAKPGNDKVSEQSAVVAGPPDADHAPAKENSGNNDQVEKKGPGEN